MDRLRATLRSAEGVKSIMLATGNPGGPGHAAVRARYIDPAPLGYKPIVNPESGQTRIFIPSKLQDNRILMANDPTYEQRLRSIDNPTLVKAWLHGDWDIVSSGFWDDLWVPSRHVLPHFRVPPGWTYKRSFDWGFSAPSSLGLYAVSDGSPVPEFPGMHFPRGSHIRIGEWYTVAKDRLGVAEPNKGLRLSNTALGRGIAERCRGRNWLTSVADPSIFPVAGRASIYDDLRKGASEVGYDLSFQPAENDRVAGWSVVRDFLEQSALDRPEKPGLWIMENCTEFLRTFPVLQRDDKKPDDIDTDAEDHAADDLRYCLHAKIRKMNVGKVAFG
jgi:hypothetical protein